MATNSPLTAVKPWRIAERILSVLEKTSGPFFDEDIVCFRGADVGEAGRIEDVLLFARGCFCQAWGDLLKKDKQKDYTKKKGKEISLLFLFLAK